MAAFAHIAEKDMMNRRTISKILFLAREPSFVHGIPAALHGITHVAATRDEFLSQLTLEDAGILLVHADGLPELPVNEILASAHHADPNLPVFVIGNDTAREKETGRPAPLPVTMEHRLQDSPVRELWTQVEPESSRVADILRENQKLVTIGRLAGSIAHEINNPLESITNLLYLIELESGLPERVQHYLTLAQRELGRVVQISKQTLNFYRETSSPVQVSLSSLVEEVLVLFARKIAEKDLKIQRQYEQSEMVTVFPGEMRQVLSNLVTNAIEASVKGGKLFLRIRPARKWSDAGIRGVRVSIGDTGGGISQEVRQHLGEPFFTTKGQGGTGLGLWVTRSIIHRYGGELQLRSTIDAERHGTVFSFFLPTNLRPQVVSRAGGGRGVAAPARMPGEFDHHRNAG